MIAVVIFLVINFFLFLMSYVTIIAQKKEIYRWQFKHRLLTEENDGLRENLEIARDSVSNLLSKPPEERGAR